MNRLRSAMLMPVWTVQLFGTAKSFRDNPLIGSTRLNRLGLHAVRLVAAHGINRLRHAKRYSGMYATICTTLSRPRRAMFAMP